MTTDLHRVQTQLEQARAELEAAIHLAGDSEPNHEKIKKPSAERAADSMFRSAYRVQMDLTALADNKANMMISINGIVMSIIIASVAPKLDSNPWLLLPTIVLLVGNMVSLCYAVMAARPRVKSPAVNPSVPLKPGGNLLFFGTFANIYPPILPCAAWSRRSCCMVRATACRWKKTSVYSGHFLHR